MTGSFGDRERYLEVRIGGVRRALPLDRLHGVATPARLLRLPSPPPGLCGAVTFRGQVVPVVEAGAAPAGNARGPSPLVFLRRSGEVIALRVDAVLGVHGGGGTERLDPDTLPTAPLRPPRKAAAAMHRAEPRPSPRLPGLLLRIGGRPFWLGADQALEVLQSAEPTPVPWADPLLPALLLHGGEPVAVARLDLLLGTGAVPNGPWLVCQAGAERLAFRIDDVPTLAGRGDAPSLDLPGLLRSLSGDVAQARPSAPQPEAASRAYMAIKLQGQLCLLPLEQVRSVSAAVRLVTLPGASAALGGARAVRGRVLPVVDPRPLLGLDVTSPSPVHLEVVAAGAPAFVLAIQLVDSVVRVRTDAIARGTGGAIGGVLELQGRRAWLLDGAGLLHAARVVP